MEAVTREVLLLNAPPRLPPSSRCSKTMRARCRGTWAVHASRCGRKTLTAIGRLPASQNRRRFWEKCFQAADPSGTQSQLRSQLRILYDSLQEIRGGAAREP